MITLAMAAGFPLLNAGLIVHPEIDPRWLALPDALIALGLIGSLGNDPLRLLWLSVSVILMGFSFSGMLPAGILPGWVFLLLARVFERSLHPATGTPIITAIAARAHGPDDPLTYKVIRYTRNLTQVWAFLFLCLALGNLLAIVYFDNREALYFGNTLSPIIIVCFLFAEWPVRRHLLKDQKRTPIHKLIKMLMLDGWREQP